MSESRSDIELLREFAERASESAFEALVQRHADLVFATAMRRVGQEAVAQEITQDVFIALARKAAWLGDGSSLAGWLYKATLHKANHWWRGEMRRRQRENTAAELNTTMKDDQAPLNAMQTVLDDGLLTLGEGERQALLLRFLERYSLKWTPSSRPKNEGAKLAFPRVRSALDVTVSDASFLALSSPKRTERGQGPEAITGPLPARCFG